MSSKLNVTVAMLVAAFSGAPANAQSSTPPPSAPSPAEAVRPYVHGHDLLTPDERQAFRDRMRQAQTREERQQVRDAMHALAEQRAKEKGVTLPPWGTSEGMRGRHGAHRAGVPATGSGAGDASGWGRVYDRVFTQQERDRFREQMREAPTPEARAKLWSEQRALAEQRAKERGLAIPEARGERARSPDDGRGIGRGPAAYGQLFSAEELETFRARMQAAQTPDERAKLRADQRRVAEQRAKERGVTLPAPGTGRGRGIYAQLFTTEEREAFRAKMQAAQTPEERAKLWADQRDLAEQRAKERGVTLPAPRTGHGRGVYAQLFTTEEREAFRAKMQAAQTSEERAKLWADQRRLAEQRAEQRGVTLPPDRAPRGAPSTGVPTPPAPGDASTNPQAATRRLEKL
jgi:Spy/CpxP family protein refolding chaperone